MTPAHPNARLEALSDGVFAIALTLLILDVRLPDPDSLKNNSEVWRALGHVAPSAFAFVLSFLVILIAWVNHHAALRLVRHASAAYIFANGFLLLTVVSIPFPTTLLGEFIWTDHAAPAVVLYNAVLALQAVGWILLTAAARHGELAVDERSAATIRTNGKNGYFALAFYGLLAVAAVWAPLPSAIVNAASWAYWLVLGIRQKHA